MSKNKPRHNPDKPQNKYGGNGCCPNFDTANGKEFCHDEPSQNNPWNELVLWDKIEDDKLVCQGNRHTCYKMKLKWIASLPDKEREKYLNANQNDS